ncbi:MAG: molecular chaperone DnaK, partial [Thermoplasmata archaeon]|nr:molecular chaperone DnaK [Thermoplasmata archaeon]
QKITVSGSTKLSDAEVERMRKDAEEHAAEDAAFRERVEARNQADQAAFSAAKLVEESGAKLGAHKAGVESALADLRKVLEAQDASAEELKAKTEALHKAMEPAVMELYKDQAQQAGAGGEGAPAGEGGAWTGNPDDASGPIDTDFRTEDKDKKGK